MNINKNYSVIYEVNIKAKNEIANEYFNWLKDIHIKEILECDGFISATLYTLDDMEHDKENQYMTVVYYLESREKLNKYFETKASEKRACAINLFGDKFSASRRILSVSQQFN